MRSRRSGHNELSRSLRAASGLLLATAWATSPSAQLSFERDYDRGDRQFFPHGTLHTSDGGYLISGEAFVTGTQQSRPYLMKLDEGGDVSWHREYTAIQGFHHAEAVLPLGPNAYVALLELDSFEKTALFAVDANGGFLAARGYSLGAAELSMEDFVRTRDGGFLLVGHTFRPTTGTDIAVLKLGPDGGVQWYRELAGSIQDPLFAANDFATNAVPARDGTGYFICGLFETDAYLAKLDLTGNPVFERTYGVAGAALFESGLTFRERASGGGVLIANANLSSDLFPLVLNLDATGRPDNTTVASLPLSATRAIPTAGGGFAIAGSSLLVPGANGIRLAKYDANAALEWAFQYDVQPTFAAINPPANLVQSSDGGYLVTMAALSGAEPIQHVVKVDGSGASACGATPVSGPFVFEIESESVSSAMSAPTVTSPLFGMAVTPLAIDVHDLCEETPTRAGS